MPETPRLFLGLLGLGLFIPILVITLLSKVVADEAVALLLIGILCRLAFFPDRTPGRVISLTPQAEARRAAEFEAQARAELSDTVEPGP